MKTTDPTGWSLPTRIAIAFALLMLFLLLELWVITDWLVLRHFRKKPRIT